MYVFGVKMLTIEELKKLHDKAYRYSTVTRERAADDLVFYWVTQWDDNLLEDSQLQYRGEFNILRKAGRQIISDLQANPIQNDFEPKDEDRQDSADIMDGIYRSGLNHNTSIQAFDTGSQESIVCGMGAWELITEYETLKDNENNNQVIKRKPIYEANNTVYFDPNARLLDKSDANYCSVLTAYSEDGYLDLVEELKGERPDTVNMDSFKEPEQSYAFPWLGGENKNIYVTSFYHREMVKEKVVLVADPLGQEMTLKESEIESVMDDLIDSGFEIISEKSINRYKVTKYIASGEGILESTVIPGENIPVVPVYGEHAYIESQEHYEGITRLAKDPQRLRNFQMSYLADIVSRSPRQKPMFLPEQIKSFEYMYNETGSDNNYPYLLQNRADEAGDLPFGPVGQMPEQKIPDALIASINLSRESVEDVANPGLPQDIADPDLSGKAVLALQNRLDMQSMIYQEHLKHAKRRDGEIFASMASEIYDIPRKVKLTRPDGSTETVMLMETVIDDSGEIVTLRDLTNVEFDVYSTIGPSFSSKKEQTIDKIATMVGGMDAGDPMRQALILKMLVLMDGTDFEDIRDYANLQLILSRVKEPETEDEKQKLAQMQQAGNQPSAEMILAMAEDKKGQADLMEQQRKNIEFQAKHGIDLSKVQIDRFEAQTDRINTQIEAQKAGADIDYKRVDTFGKQLDNQEKIINLQQPQKMSENEILLELMG